jgi:hypothetical protein
MKNSKAQINMKELRSELLYLQRRIEDFKQSHGKDSGLSNLLRCIEGDLLEEKPNPARLEEDSFGIFRLVTDSFVLEESEIGKQLMEFRLKLREFAATLKENK